MAFLFAEARNELEDIVGDLDAVAAALAAIDPNVNPVQLSAVVGQVITHVQRLSADVHRLAELLRSD